MVLNVGIIGFGKMGLMHSAILSSMEGVSVQAISENNKNITKYIESVKSDWNVYLDYNKTKKHINETYNSFLKYG